MACLVSSSLHIIAHYNIGMPWTLTGSHRGTRSMWTPLSSTSSTLWGVGVLIRDHEGSMFAAMSKHLPLLLGLLEGEGTTLDEAVPFAWDIGIRDVIFEIDSRIVFDALSGTITPPIAIANLIVNIQDKLHSFRSTLFSMYYEAATNQLILWQNMPRELTIS